MAVLGSNPPAKVVINELTTVASVWTHAQFLDGTAIKGHALGLRIAAGNVPNFVDLETGGWGSSHPGPSQQRPDADDGQFRDAGGRAGRLRHARDGGRVRQAVRCGHATERCRPDRHPDRGRVDRPLSLVPTRAVVRPARPVLSGSPGQDGRPTETAKHAAGSVHAVLSWAPSAWVLPLKFDGGGYRAGGKAMFDSEGNLWVGDNFTIGWQGQDALWQGNASKFAPNGKPLSPITTGFTGGGMEGGTFGAAVDAHDNAWFTTYGGHSIAVFDKNGKPLTPPEGITFDGRLGLMQGIIVTPSGDVWALGVSKSQLVYFPKGDLTKGRIVCEGSDAGTLQVVPGAVPSRDRPAGPNLGVQRLCRTRDAISRCRSEQGRDVLFRGEPQRT